MNQETYEREEGEAAMGRIKELEAELAAYKRAVCQRGENPDELTPEKVERFFDATYIALEGAKRDYADFRRQLTAKTAELEAVKVEAKHNATAYLGALGHAVPGDHDGKLGDGSEPQNVLARFLSREVEEEASRHRATTRELEAARGFIEDRERIITRYDANLKATIQRAASVGQAVKAMTMPTIYSVMTPQERGYLEGKRDAANEILALLVALGAEGDKANER